MKAKIYTKTGDHGQTSLVDGTRVAKTHARLEAYGTLDELNCVIGMIRVSLNEAPNRAPELLRLHVETRLQGVQNALFNVGSRLACPEREWLDKMPNVDATHVGALEADMDQWETSLPPLRNFILPGGHPTAAGTHLARTICRRAERVMVGLPSDTVGLESTHLIYLNRLSDWLFLLARQFNAAAGVVEPEWSKG